MISKQVLSAQFLVLSRKTARLAVVGWAYARCDWYCFWSIMLWMEARCTLAAWHDGRIVLIAAVSGSIARDTIEVHRVFLKDPILPPLDGLPVKVRFRP